MGPCLSSARISLRWRLGHIRRLLSEDRNGAWLGRQTEPTGVAGRKADSAAAALLRDLFAGRPSP